MLKSLLLASQSPRRAQLLQSIKIPFQQQAVDVDETVLPQELPPDYLRRVTELKFDAAQARFGQEFDCILVADTTVVSGQTIMGKPQDEAQACEYLKVLSGATHQVMTYVIAGDQRQKKSIQVATEVTFTQISHEQAQKYWATGEPKGKAGGYAIQGIGAVFIESIRGSYSNVVGLPLFETAQLLDQFDITVL